MRGLDDDGLAEPVGPAEGPYAEAPCAALVLHIHREVIHHGAEIALLRDLYAHQRGRAGLRGGTGRAGMSAPTTTVPWRWPARGPSRSPSR